MANRKGGFIGQDGINAPDEPTGVAGAAGDAQVDVSFTPPADVGAAAVTEYRVTDSTGTFGVTGSASPITVTGLTNDVSYTFNVWAINPFGWSSPSDASGSVSPAAARAIVGTGEGLSSYDVFTMATTGNATDFGDSSQGGTSVGDNMSSSTRSIFWSGYANSEFTTFASTGTFSNFGDLSPDRQGFQCASNSTRGLLAAGDLLGTPYLSIQYVTIATAGTPAAFGDLTEARKAASNSAFASPTRACFAGGAISSGGWAAKNVIDYVTIGTTGNAVDFGDLTVSRGLASACSSSTRGLVMGGTLLSPATRFNTIDYVTIATAGNATDFGDLQVVTDEGAATSSSTRGLYAGGRANGTATNQIQYVTIASTGNSTDFGDLLENRYRHSAGSSAHGGLS